jgi:hypothetical protein
MGEKASEALLHLFDAGAVVGVDALAVHVKLEEGNGGYAWGEA